MTSRDPFRCHVSRYWQRSSHLMCDRNRFDSSLLSRLTILNTLCHCSTNQSQCFSCLFEMHFFLKVVNLSVYVSQPCLLGIVVELSVQRHWRLYPSTIIQVVNWYWSLLNIQGSSWRSMLSYMIYQYNEGYCRFHSEYSDLKNMRTVEEEYSIQFMSNFFYE